MPIHTSPPPPPPPPPSPNVYWTFLHDWNEGGKPSTFSVQDYKKHAVHGPLPYLTSSIYSRQPDLANLQYQKSEPLWLCPFHELCSHNQNLQNILLPSDRESSTQDRPQHHLSRQRESRLQFLCQTEKKKTPLLQQQCEMNYLINERTVQNIPLTHELNLV